jgi:hypothetical protein
MGGFLKKALKQAFKETFNQALKQTPSDSVQYQYISIMYFSHWKPPGVSERMWSVKLDALISGEYRTLGVHSCWPSE